MCSDLKVRVAIGAATLVLWSQSVVAGKCSSRSIVVITTNSDKPDAENILREIKEPQVWLTVRDGTAGDKQTYFYPAGSGMCFSKKNGTSDNCEALKSIYDEHTDIEGCMPPELKQTVLNLPIDIIFWGTVTCATKVITIKTQKFQVNKTSSEQELEKYVKKVKDYCGGCADAPDLGTAQVTTAYAGQKATIQGRSVYPNGAEMKYRCKGDQTDKPIKCTDEKWSPVDCPKPTDSSKSTTGDKGSTNLPLYIGLAIGILIIAIGVVATILLVVRRKKKAASSDPNSPSAGGPGGKPGLGFSNPNADQSMVEVSVAAPSSSAEPSVPISSRHNWPIKQVTRSQMDKSPSAKANLSAKSVKEKTETSGKGSGKEGIPRSLKVPASPKVPGSPKSQGSPKITLTIPVSSKEGSPEQSSILKKK